MTTATHSPAREGFLCEAAKLAKYEEPEVRRAGIALGECALGLELPPASWGALTMTLRTFRLHHDLGNHGRAAALLSAVKEVIL